MRRPRKDTEHLYERGGTIYFRAVVGGVRRRVSLETDNWDEARRLRERLLEEMHGTAPVVADLVKLAAFAPRYLEHIEGDLARTTVEDRRRHLADGGPLLRHLGGFALDAIDGPALSAWWAAEVKARGLSNRTGSRYLDTLSGVFDFAIEAGVSNSNPTPLQRAALRRMRRTQRGRAAEESHVRPIEDPETLDALVVEAAAEDPHAEVFVLLQLDAGLRVGEALALQWGDIHFGRGKNDERRHLRIQRSRSRGGPSGLTKSGRERTVPLSRRLARALRAHQRDAMKPGPSAEVLPRTRRENFTRREWRRILERAGTGARRLKDLRDTFASQLLTAGVQLMWVSRALGHADIATTSKHYAKWCDGDEYRDPMVRAPGEVPTDLLSRLPRREATIEATKRGAVSGLTRKKRHN